jgi:hypothetical protein
MRHRMFLATLACFACSNNVPQGDDPRVSVQPRMVIPGSPLEVVYERIYSSLEVDYGEPEDGSLALRANLLGGPTLFPLSLAPSGQATFNTTVPDAVDTPSNAYRVQLVGSDRSFEHELTVLALKSEITECVPGEPPHLDLNFVDVGGNVQRPGHPVTLTFEVDGQLLNHDCSGPAEPPTFFPNADAPITHYCLSGTRGLTIGYGSRTRPVTIDPFLDQVPLVMERDVSANECLTVGVDCPDCGPIAVARFNEGGGWVDQPLYADAKCEQAATAGEGKVYLRLPPAASELQLMLGGCGWRGQGLLSVHPQLRTLAAVAIGVPFPIDLPPGCQPIASSGRLVAGVQANLQGGTTLYTLEGPRAADGERVRIRCGARPDQPLSAPIVLTWCDQALREPELNFAPRTIAGAPGTTHPITFQLANVPSGVAAAVLAPSGAADLVWTELDPSCSRELCFQHTYRSLGMVGNAPRVHTPEVMLWDHQGCVVTADRALIEAPMTSTFTVTSTGNGERVGNLTAALEWLANRPPNAPIPVLRLSNLLRAPGVFVQLDYPVYVVGGDGILELGELKIGAGAEGTFLSGLQLLVDRIQVEADRVLWRDSTIRWVDGPADEPLLRVVGGGVILGPNLTLVAERLERELVSLEGEQGQLQRVELYGGRVGLLLHAPAEVDQVVIADASDVALEIRQPNETTRFELRHLTIDSPRDGLSTESTVTLQDSIVRAAREPFRDQGQGQVVVLRSWIQPAGNLGIPNAGPIGNTTFVDPRNGDYRLQAEAYGVDPAICEAQPCLSPTDLNGPLPGNHSGRFPDLGAHESTYSTEAP